MKYVDYREKLGIGFNDEQKAAALSNKIRSFFYGKREELEAKINCDLSNIARLYAEETCAEIYDFNFPGIVDELTESFFDVDNNLKDIIAKFVIFANLVVKNQNNNRFVEDTKKLIPTTLIQLKIPYEIFNDDDGIFIFPKGAEELDDSLVSEPLEWMKDYPTAHGAYIKALKSYAECTENNASDVSDLFRKALESFFQEFFNSEKSLENMISDYGSYLKNKGIPKEISNNFEKLLNQYTDFMNNYAKHHDKTSVNVLEYIMYQTGNIIRLLITLKKQENNNAN